MAVVPDVDAQFVGDGDFDGQTGCAGMPKNVADGFCEDSFSVLGEISIDSGHRTVFTGVMTPLAASSDGTPEEIDQRRRGDEF